MLSKEESCTDWCHDAREKRIIHVLNWVGIFLFFFDILEKRKSSKIKKALYIFFYLFIFFT